MTRLLSTASALCLAAALGLSAPALAQTSAPAAAAAPKPADDAVVARVNGIEIRQSDLNAAEEDIGSATARMGEEQKRDYLIGFVSDLMLAAKAGEAKKLGDDAEFKRKLEYNRRKLLAESLLAAETKAKVTEAEIKRIYDEEIKKVAVEEEISARHILVKTEEEAKAIADKLKAGGDFAEIAKEKSEDPGSKTDGGSLGFFTKDQMVEEFSSAAFALKPGEVSAPVKTKFGYHIIKLEERRKKEPPSLEQVRGQIEDFIARKAHSDLIGSLRKDAKIERIGPDGKVIEPKPAEAKPAEEPKKQ